MLYRCINHVSNVGKKSALFKAYIKISLDSSFIFRFLLCFYSINMSIEKYEAVNSDMDTYSTYI